MVAFAVEAKPSPDRYADASTLARQDSTSRNIVSQKLEFGREKDVPLKEVLAGASSELLNEFDPGFGQDKFFPSDPDEGHEFGVSVDVDGDTIVAGARSYDKDLGAVYVYQRKEVNGRSRVVQTSRLTPPGAGEGSRFGTSVSISGDFLAVGAPRFGGSGATFVYTRRPDQGWELVSTFLQGNGVQGAEFGFSVSLRGDILLVGAFADNTNVDKSGAAYLIRRVNGVWTRQQKLQASDAQVDAEFGRSVSVGEGTLLVGAWSQDEGAEDSGVAYLFRQGANGTWSLTQKLSNPRVERRGRFGRSVSAGSSVLAVGAWGDSVGGASSGAVHLYRQASVSRPWQRYQTLRAPDAAAGDAFGFSVALDESANALVVGAFGQDELGLNSGSAYLYQRDPTGSFNLSAQLFAEDGERQDTFGRSVAVSGMTTVVGSRGDDDFGSFSGSAYVFTPGSQRIPAPVGGMLPFLGLGLGLITLGRRQTKRPELR